MISSGKRSECVQTELYQNYHCVKDSERGNILRSQTTENQGSSWTKMGRCEHVAGAASRSLGPSIPIRSIGTWQTPCKFSVFPNHVSFKAARAQMASGKTTSCLLS